MAKRTRAAAVVSLVAFAAAAVPAEQASAWGQPELAPSCTKVEYSNATFQGRVELTVWVDGNHVTTVVTDRVPFTIPLNPGPGVHRIGVRAREADNPKAAERYREVTEDCGKPVPPVVVPPSSTVPPAVTPPATTPPAKPKPRPKVCVRGRTGPVRIVRHGRHARLKGRHLTRITWRLGPVRIGAGRSVLIPGPLAGQRLTVSAGVVGKLGNRRKVCHTVRRAVRLPNAVPPGGGGLG